MNLGTCQSGCKIKRIVWLVSPCLLQFDNGWSRSESGAGITREKGKENKRIWLIVAFECRDNLHYRIVFKGFLTSKTFSKSGNLWITAGGDALGAASESWNLQPPAVFPSQTHNFVIFLGRCTNTQSAQEGFKERKGLLLCSRPFEVFNSSFVISSSTGISSLSVLAQPFRLLLRVGAAIQHLGGTVCLICRNVHKMKFFLFQLPLSSHQLKLKRPLRPRVSSGVCACAERCPVPVFLKKSKCIKERSSAGATASLSSFFPPPQHRLLIFKSTAIAWCGFKCWGAILPDDDSADVNGILIMPSATSETSPLRLLLFTVSGLSVKPGPDFYKYRDSLLLPSKLCTQIYPSSARQLAG